MAEGEPRSSSSASTDDAHIRTFLIADVRGYTVFTQEHGDEAAARLAHKFAAVAREGVEAGGGTVVELRGDEALAVFDSARQAIRASVELQRRFVDETVASRRCPSPSASAWTPERRSRSTAASAAAPSTSPRACAGSPVRRRSSRAPPSRTSRGRSKAWRTWTAGPSTSRASPTRST